MPIRRGLALVLLLAACDPTPPIDLPDAGPCTGAAAAELACGPLVTNLDPAESLRFQLAFLSGETADETGELAAAGFDGTTRWPIRAHRFKALVRLAPGDNDVALTDSAGTRHVTIRHDPQSNPRFVRLVWIRAADGDGTFDAPPGEPRDEASALARLRTAGLLMQTFTAESLHRMGFGRRTFRLETAADGLPEVTVFRSSLTMAQAHAMDGGALWSHFYGELAALPRRDDAIDVAMMSMTRFDPSSGTARAHTALGGGRLGLFGSAGLHAWAASVEEIPARWTDGRTLDTAALYDDSASRGTFWANFATGLGATLHELGHCLSLPHPASHVGVMSREFDHVNRLFMLVEPPSRTSAGLDPIHPVDEKLWDPSHATRLRHHRWLALDDLLYPLDAPPTIRLIGGEVQIESAAGVRHVEYRIGGDSADFEAFPGDPPRQVRRTLEQLRARLPDAATVGVNVIDDAGNIGEREIALE